MKKSRKKITQFLSIPALFLSFFLLNTEGVLAQETATRMTLDEAINYALQNVNSIKNAKQNISDADLRIKENKASGLPKVEAEVNLNHFLQQPSLPGSALGFGQPTPIDTWREGRLVALENKNGLEGGSPPQIPDFRLAFQLKNDFNAGITASQLIFSGSYTVALKASKLYRELVNVQVKTREEEVRNRVIEAYLPALMIDEAVKTINKNITNLEKLRAEIAATYKAGFVEQLDVDRLDFTIVNLKSQRDNALQQRDLPINALKFMMNYPLEKPLELADDLDKLLEPASEGDMKNVVDYQKRAAVRELDASMKLVELNVELNKASALPTVAAFANYRYAFQGNQLNNLFGVPSALIGITAKYTIWDNNDRKIKTQRAQIQVEQLRTSKRDLENAINLEVMNARKSVEIAQKNLESQNTNLILAEKIADVTQRKYKQGVGSSLEVITAERDIFTGQQAVRQAKYDLLVAQKRLKIVLGAL